MANLRDKGIRLTAKGFDLERRKLYPPNTVLVFLRPNSRTQVFDELKRFHAGFIARTNKFTNQKQIEIASLEDLREIICKTTHFFLDNAVYAVTEGSVSLPIGDDFTWKIAGTISVNENFVP